MTIVGQILSVPVRLYRYLISPMLPPTCRYTPTCSEYALDALRIHGGLAGGWLALRRIARCHPWGGAGFDPVPASARKAHCKRHGEASMANERSNNAPITPIEVDRK